MPVMEYNNPDQYELDLTPSPELTHSRLAMVRSTRSPVSTPIAASSDESAVFELIYTAGGRMPEA